MKIEHEAYFCLGVLIRAKPIRDLLSVLKAKGIEFSEAECLQKTSYHGGEATIPISWTVGEGGYVQEYVLRNNQLRIALEDFQEHHFQKSGVKARLNYEGGSEGVKLIETVQNVLREFYG